jgi:hypothetical protein
MVLAEPAGEVTHALDFARCRTQRRVFPNAPLEGELAISTLNLIDSTDLKQPGKECLRLQLDLDRTACRKVLRTLALEECPH